MRLPWLSVFGAVVLAASSSVPAADSFTVGVLSCAAESDRSHRLDCYDRAVANYTAGLTHSERHPAAESAPAVAGNSAATAAVGSPGPGTASASAAKSEKAPSAVTRHVSGRIVSIDHFPDYVVVHLDNQQIWKQVSDSPAAPMLRDGDTVTIDRQMGSYWLSGPKGEAVQVRLEAPKP